MLVKVTATFDDTVLAEATGMQRECIEFVIKSIGKQLDNGLLERIAFEDVNDLEPRTIEIKISRR